MFSGVEGHPDWLWRRRSPTLEAALSIVTPTSTVLVFGTGGKWRDGFWTRRFGGGGLSYTEVRCLELIRFALPSAFL